ncbi:hypothetical protein SBV1_1910003 [Verrucomicrobia bacterium]|nr:hypothetical protein SBV1_1910003 [Verrucomicrobiota bacterium]
MNPDGSETTDAVDLLLKVAIFLCFIVFGICLWLIRRERDKRKGQGTQNAEHTKGV